MRCTGKFGLQIFQKAILMQINGTKVLLKILQQNGLKYMLTCKINQDALENLFSQLRGRGELDDHPTPLNALYRLRMLILEKNPGITSQQTNTTHVNNEEFIVATALKKINLKINNVENLDESGSTTESDNVSLQEIDNKYKMEDATEYLAGWVAKKFKIQFPELGSTTTKCNLESPLEHDYQIPTWIHHLSYGGLIAPSQDFKNKVFRIERLFKKITKNQMPVECIVVHRFPNPRTDSVRLKKWIELVGLNEMDPNDVYTKKFICNNYFEKQCFSPGTKRLNAKSCQTLLLVLPGSTNPKLSVMSSTFKHPRDPEMSVYGTEENIVHSTPLKANILNNETVSVDRMNLDNTVMSGFNVLETSVMDEGLTMNTNAISNDAYNVDGIYSNALNNYCSILFDEVSLRSGLAYNVSSDQIDGFVN
ncbi:Uncharacterized protein FWK35_00017338 [Aphis craccivora]|uniref:Transposable element P transposase-like C-terminal domain-containing protein n=1 Tax=Aphis craccivora TaxID=307492 RepID=A0A6G0Y9F9_APHCR|nr:Uncharacterized protein FWK35_00017338 [Aphis craccivora]